VTTELSEHAEARRDIIALLDEFTSRVDHGEPIGHLFQELAVYSTPRGETRGRDAIAALFATIGASRREVGHITRHGTMSVHVIRLDAALFEVRSMMMALALERPTAANGSLLIGDHTDRVERDAEGVYRFAHRSLKPTLEFSLSRNSGASS
jgi:hypothetical protein